MNTNCIENLEFLNCWKTLSFYIINNANKMIENVFTIVFSKYGTLTVKLPNNPLTQQQKKLLFTVLTFS